MRTLPESLAGHLKNEITTLCRCWIVETEAGERLGFTDHDHDLKVEGITCERRSGMEASNIEESLGLNVNPHEVEGVLQSSKIEEADIRAGRFDRARIYRYHVNWQAPQDAWLEDVSYVGDISRQDDHFTLELRDRMAELDSVKGRHFNKQCQAELGDEHCKVDLEGPQFSTVATVLKARTEIILQVAGLEGFDSGFFTSGRITWQSGSNTGRTIEVAAHIAEPLSVDIHLWVPLPFLAEPGDSFLVTAGCDKRFSTCRAKFANSVNFRGFPHIPGNDRALSVAGGDDEFDGGPIVP